MYSPYHHFSHCTTLKRCMKQLSDNSRIPQDIYNKYFNYHTALEHKLNSAHYFLSQLIDLIENTTMVNYAENPSAFLFKANLFIDGFFYTGGSALDILARELCAYFNINTTGDVYYRHARSKIHQIHPHDPLLARLGNPPWKNEFSTYRNAATHELILSSNINWHTELTPQGQIESLKLALPDDPKALLGNRTFSNNPDVCSYCTRTFKRLLILINTIYGDIAARARANGRLPLP